MAICLIKLTLELHPTQRERERKREKRRVIHTRGRYETEPSVCLNRAVSQLSSSITLYLYVCTSIDLSIYVGWISVSSEIVSSLSFCVLLSLSPSVLIHSLACLLLLSWWDTRRSRERKKERKSGKEKNQQPTTPSLSLSLRILTPSSIFTLAIFNLSAFLSTYLSIYLYACRHLARISLCMYRIYT